MPQVAGDGDRDRDRSTLQFQNLNALIPKLSTLLVKPVTGQVPAQGSAPLDDEPAEAAHSLNRRQSHFH